MIKVLDQYEIEYKESYTSGSYDQVIMGKMFYPVVLFGKKSYVYGNRGVVYGSIESNQAPNPGNSPLDFSDSVSYRLQPYKEKAGNCRAAKHVCYEERILDTLAPDPVSCFKQNGANVFMLKDSVSQAFGRGNVGGIQENLGFIMFDNYYPSGSNLRTRLNPCVDRHWTKSFPFEPRYSKISRNYSQNFNNIEATYSGSMVYDSETNFVKLPAPRKMNGLLVGTVGPQDGKVTNSTKSLTSGMFIKNGENWEHLWACDVSSIKKITYYYNSGGPHVGTKSLTGSCGNQDMMKVLFGFGDSNTTFYSSSIRNSNDPTGYARFGTNNWPEFRAYYNTDNNDLPSSYLTNKIYEVLTGSTWAVSPVIRGWKYGLYSALPEYSSAYYRQGRYGQFRDLLEQRTFTRFFKQTSLNISETDPVVTVKFVDVDNNLTDPINTQSQNLSYEATSSLPFFDGSQRNRPNVYFMPNVATLKFSVDTFGNLTL